MTTVYVLVAVPIFDVSGDCIDTGSNVGVYATLSAAEAALEEQVKNFSFRKEYDYDIEEFDLI